MDRHVVSLVIFDFDGLMVNSEHVAYAALRDIFARYGVHGAFTWDYYCTTIGLPSAVATSHYLRDLPIPLTPDEFLAAERAGIRTHMETKLALMPGLLPLLDDLQSRGIRRVIASSSRRDYIFPILDRFGIRDAFTDVVGIDDVARGKPHPDLVLKALEVAGVPAQQALMLEDSAHGVEAAHRAGVRVIAVPTPGIAPAHFARADAVVRDLAAAHALIDGLLE